MVLAWNVAKHSNDPELEILLESLKSEKIGEEKEK